MVGLKEFFAPLLSTEMGQDERQLQEITHQLAKLRAERAGLSLSGENLEASASELYIEFRNNNEGRRRYALAEARDTLAAEQARTQPKAP